MDKEIIDFFQTVCLTHEYVLVTMTTTTENPNITMTKKWMQCKYCGTVLQGQDQIEYTETYQPEK